jgi:hypothetical protein
MPISFPALSYLYEGIEGLEEFTDLRQQEKDNMLESACPIIEQRLSDLAYLGQFTWYGFTAFYDDSPERFQETHLKDNFSVEYDGTAFQISNSKSVSGATGKPINLFEQLLYPGFGPYSVPTTNRSAMRARMGEERYAYETRTKKQRKAVEMKLYKGNLMTFYYRYHGMWYYNRSKRAGMNTSLHSKFKEYIDGAIRYGVEAALKLQIGEDDYEAARGLIT